MTARRLEYLPLADLRGAPRNPKRHALDDLAASIARHGYVEPVVLDERTGRLVSGHGRVEELRRQQAAGAAPPDGIGDDWTVPVVRGWSSRSDEEAEAFLVAANRLTETGGWDVEVLARTLADVARTAAGLAGTGFTDAQLAELIAAAAPPEPKAARTGDTWPVISIRCPPEVKARFERVTAGHGDTNAERLAWLLDGRQAPVPAKRTRKAQAG